MWHSESKLLKARGRNIRLLHGVPFITRREFMDENRIEGTARNIGGKVQEEMGRATGDVKTRAEGLTNQAMGAAQDLYGQTADAAREHAATFDTWLRNQIESQPYTTALVTLGIGWLLGRMRRPL
jgi:uncharacterized protein YjbJ (UPF0337 family)